MGLDGGDLRDRGKLWGDVLVFNGISMLLTRRIYISSLSSFAVLYSSCCEI